MMSDDDSRDSASLDERLRALKKEVRSGEAGDDDGKAGRGASGMGVGGQIAADFIAGIVVGAMFGYGLDWWFGTTPWLLVSLMLLGFAAGVRSAYRAAKRAADAEDRGGS
jgi:ATP synthase protein I